MDELALILALDNELTAADIAAAEEAAALAQQHSIGFEDGGTGLILSPIAEEV